eukprot:GHVO01039228.1.p1 GENE.GHVO01039228.1~~GHVO01039228.1.p1  ORF type:complete len:441 (+),score=43.54 GHVO01039228.1:205-1527(+)
MRPQDSARLRTLNFFARLHEEMCLLLEWLEPTKAELKMRQRVLARIKIIAEELWPKCNVETFGSYYTGLYLPCSDIDVCIQNVEGNPKENLKILANQLLNWKMAQGIEVITSARVPIVKYVDEELGIPVDISFNQESALNTSNFIRQMMNKYDHLRPLIIIIKLFIQQRGLGETYKGGVGSYLIFVMVLSFLQRQHCSYSESMRRRTTIGHLLYNFFQLYGVDFDYSNVGLSVADNGSYFSKCDRRWASEDRPFLISVESPLDRTVDIGKNSYNIRLVKNAMRHAYMTLAEAFQTNSSKDDPPVSLLKQIIFTNDPLFIRKPRHDSSTDTVKLSGSRPVPIIPLEIVRKVKEEMADVSRKIAAARKQDRPSKRGNLRSQSPRHKKRQIERMSSSPTKRKKGISTPPSDVTPPDEAGSSAPIVVDCSPEVSVSEWIDISSD